VIVPRTIWEWDDYSKICIRFGHPELGKWKYNCGLSLFKERYNYLTYWSLFTATLTLLSACRRIDDELSEMTCELSIPQIILEKPIQYKYLINSPKAKTENDWYEVIPTQHGSIPNRALSIYKHRLYNGEFSQSNLSSHKFIFLSTGVYHQYDTFAYPKIVKSYYESAKGVFGWGSHPQNSIEMRQRCLSIYLDEYLNLIDKNILCIVTGIAGIFSCISRESYFPERSPHPVLNQIVKLEDLLKVYFVTGVLP